MIILIHGDQLEHSRNKLAEHKAAAKDKEIRVVDGKRADQTQLAQALESRSLFGNDVLIVIEGFLSHAKKREKTFVSVLTKLVEVSASSDIILYEEKEIDKSTISKLGTKIQVELFKTPVVLFQFLDSLRPGNARVSLDNFARTVELEPAEVVFVLIARRVRQLIQLADHVMPAGLQEWQAARLTSQARHFTIKQLVAMQEQLLTIDIAIKTGATPFTLSQLLEQFIIKL